MSEKTLKNKKKRENSIYTVQIPSDKEKEFKIYVNSIKGRLIYNNNNNISAGEEKKADSLLDDKPKKSFIHMFEEREQYEKNDAADNIESVAEQEKEEKVKSEFIIEESTVIEQNVNNEIDDIHSEKIISFPESDNEKPHWIHDQVEDNSYASGFKVLRSCICSYCGYHANTEKEYCPKCNNKMI